jgi:adenosylhomocysteine nucleosidase
VFVSRAGADPGADEETRFWFEVDGRLLDAARRIAAHQSGLPRLAIGGQGVSGAPFVDNAEFRTWLRDCFRAEVLDQETAAVAQVAYVNRIPFLAVRAVSDLAGGDSGPNAYAGSVERVAESVALVVRALCRELAASSGAGGGGPGA